MDRRTFLKTSTAAALVTFAGRGRARAADAEMELSLGDLSAAATGTVISPHLYGHFIEHLGGVIYDGVWVGRNSSIPNLNGIRKQFVDDMKRIGAPNLRWPGGCFADGYHWRDGIGKSPSRPRTYNFWQRRMPAGTDATETNQFGIHEFMDLCHQIGAVPYVAANVGSGTPSEFHDWVAYCNAPVGTLSLADERAAAVPVLRAGGAEVVLRPAGGEHNDQQQGGKAAVHGIPSLKRRRCSTRRRHWTQCDRHTSERI